MSTGSKRTLSSQRRECLDIEITGFLSRAALLAADNGGVCHLPHIYFFEPHI